MSRQTKDDFLRHYTVSDPRTHAKGYTEYKVTAQFISKKDPEDVKEVTSHAPPRWWSGSGTVTSASCMGTWPTPTATSSAAWRSSHPSPVPRCLGGEVTRPCEVSRDLHILPPPLIPTPPPDEPRLPQPLPAERRGLEELEVSADPPPSSPAQEALDLLFNCGSTEEASGSPAQGPLSEAELALFDPFSKEEGAGPSPTHIGELAAMEVESTRLNQEPWEPGGQEEEEDGGGPRPAYLSQATELITQALRDEKAGAYPAALQGYRDGVHILLQGVPSDPSPARREGVKKKAAEYLKRAEEILHLHLSQLPP
ncbi:sorting nexin-15 isoform X2 [Marmota marmota marmota]|uniref:sorting nexin-15 isoform X2 n=1 Tax=Marmota marmota marmota TaxID=9994 RepID=UPI002093ACA4|nr:sorting nexin-15 isoform X2 [Marmota marmota marmota]